MKAYTVSVVPAISLDAIAASPGKKMWYALYLTNSGAAGWELQDVTETTSGLLFLFYTVVPNSTSPKPPLPPPPPVPAGP